MPSRSLIYSETFGHGPDLVMVHGWSMNLEVWREFAQTLATQYRVTCVDLPGHGRSLPMVDYSLPAIADELLQVAPAQAHWLGWSLGATLALYIAAKQPERVLRLLLIGGNARFVAAEDWPCGMNADLLQSSMVNLEQDYRAALMGFMTLQTFGLEDARHILKSMRKRLAGSNSPDREALQGGLQVLMDTDLRPCLVDVSSPGLLLLGDKDHLVPVETGAAMRALWPGLQVKVIEGAGHVPFLSHLQRCSEIVLGFLHSDESVPDKRQAGRSFTEAAEKYDSVARLQQSVGERLLNNVLLQPGAKAERILDVGSGTGFCSNRLAVKAEGSRVLALDFALGMLHYARAHRPPSARIEWLCADAEHLPLADGSVDRIVSNLAIQWCPQIKSVLAGFRRVLTSGGRLHFSTFTGRTLQELRMAWAEADSYAHVNDFVSVVEMEMTLRQVGFADISIETETRTVYYPAVLNLMHELKTLGAHNVTRGRARHLTGKSAFQRMLAAYESLREAEGYPATFDVLYVSAKVP